MSLVVLHYNKAIDLWNLVHTYNLNVVIGTESWLKEDIRNGEILRDDFTTLRRDVAARGGGGVLCVKNIIASTELWVDDDCEMIAVELKGMGPKYTWEIIGIYRAPYEETLAIERLAVRTILIQWVNALLGCTSKTMCFFLVLVWELTPEICPSILVASYICHLAILHNSATIIISSWCHEACIKTLIFISYFLLSSVLLI